MRGKRSKQYRKLMQQYSQAFGFREPYQVIVDAEMLLDTHRFAMDLPAMLSRTLHGTVKPMITQCSIRHLYALPATHASASAPKPAAPVAAATATASQPLTAPVASSTKTALLDLARTLTLRRCGHHTLPEPLSPAACVASVLDPGASGTNKHRLVLAVQDASARRWARAEVRGVPGVYVKRSVMVMEPMSDASARARLGVERGKIKGEAKAEGKRKREGEEASEGEGRAEVAKKRKVKGPKEPNPLSIRKRKTKEDQKEDDGAITAKARAGGAVEEVDTKRKRRRKHAKSGAGAEVGLPAESPAAEEAD